MDGRGRHLGSLVKALSSPRGCHSLHFPSLSLGLTRVVRRPSEAQPLVQVTEWGREVPGARAALLQGPSWEGGRVLTQVVGLNLPGRWCHLPVPGAETEMESRLSPGPQVCPGRGSPDL